MDIEHYIVNNFLNKIKTLSDEQIDNEASAFANQIRLLFPQIKKIGFLYAKENSDYSYTRLAIKLDKDVYKKLLKYLYDEKQILSSDYKINPLKMHLSEDADLINKYDISTRALKKFHSPDTIYMFAPATLNYPLKSFVGLSKYSLSQLDGIFHTERIRSRLNKKEGLHFL